MLGEQSTIVKNLNSSLPLQIFVHFSWHFDIFFFLLNLCLFTYKAIRYYYPSSSLAWDIVTIFLFLFVDFVRLLFVSKGNKTSQAHALVKGLILAIPLFVLHSYYMELQTYVLLVDMVINAIALFFLSTETLLAILMIINISIAAKQH